MNNLIAFLGGFLPEDSYAAQLEALRDAVTVGVADIEAGRYETFDDPANLETWIMTLGPPARPPK